MSNAPLLLGACRGAATAEACLQLKEKTTLVRELQLSGLSISIAEKTGALATTPLQAAPGGRPAFRIRIEAAPPLDLGFCGPPATRVAVLLPCSAAVRTILPCHTTRHAPRSGACTHTGPQRRCCAGLWRRTTVGPWRVGEAWPAARTV